MKRISGHPIHHGTRNWCYGWGFLTRNSSPGQRSVTLGAENDRFSDFLAKISKTGLKAASLWLNLDKLAKIGQKWHKMAKMTVLTGFAR